MLSSWRAKSNTSFPKQFIDSTLLPLIRLRYRTAIFYSMAMTRMRVFVASPLDFNLYGPSDVHYGTHRHLHVVAAINLFWQAFGKSKNSIPGISTFIGSVLLDERGMTSIFVGWYCEYGRQTGEAPVQTFPVIYAFHSCHTIRAFPLALVSG